MGDIFVISDLHLGDGGPRDNFELGGRTKQLHAFIDHVGGEGGELFVLGDLFELWQVNLSGLIVKRHDLITHLLAVPLVYVPGNHDVDLVHFIGAPFVRHPLFARMRLPFERELGGRRFYFSHGHETDPFNSGEDPGFGRMLTIFAGVFEDRNKSPLLASGQTVETVLEQFGESMLALWTSAAMAMEASGQGPDVEPSATLTPAQNPHRLGEHIAGTRAERERRGHDVAVLGHTHRPGRIDDWYHNSGSWTGERNSFLRIDAEGHVRHFEWREGRALEVAPVELLADPKKPSNPFRVATRALKALFPRPTPPPLSRAFQLLQGAVRCSLGLGAVWIAQTAGWQTALRLLVLAFGAYVVVDGALVLLAARREPQTTKRLLDRIRGVAGVVLGLVVLRHAGTPAVFTLLVGFWALLGGALRVAAAALFRHVVSAKWLRIVGVVAIGAGIVLLLVPRSTVWMTWTASAFLVVDGLVEMLGAVFGREVARSRTGSGRPKLRLFSASAS